MTQPEDKSILHEVVRVIEARRRVPERIRVGAREYLITYLEDHRNRLEEALRRYDTDRLNMLFGQLASKIKYQFNRRVAARTVPGQPAKAKAAKKKSAGKKKAPAKKAKKSTAAGKASGRKKTAAKKHK